MSRSVAPRLALLLPLAAAAALAQPPAVEETLDVREAAVLAELPEGAEPGLAGPSLAVEELGVARPVTSVEALAGAWRVRVLIDGDHCRPETRRAALLALGARAEALVALGAVEIVEGSEPPGDAPTSDPAELARRLAARAEGGPCRDALGEAIAEAEGRLAAGAAPGPLADELWRRIAAEVRAASDRIKVTPCEGGACLLLWVAGGTALRPDLLASEALRGEAAAEAVAAIERDRRELAEALAVQGWRVVALAGFDAAPAGPAADRKAEARAEGVPAAPPEEGRIFPSQPWMSKPRGPAPEALARSLDLELAGLRTLASRTGGALAQSGGELDRRLAAAARVVRVWIRTDSPRDGRAHEVAVRWTGSRPPRELAAGRWLVSGESEALAAARARVGAR